MLRKWIKSFFAEKPTFESHYFFYLDIRKSRNRHQIEQKDFWMFTPQLLFNPYDKLNSKKDKTIELCLSNDLIFGDAKIMGINQSVGPNHCITRIWVQLIIEEGLEDYDSYETIIAQLEADPQWYKGEHRIAVDIVCAIKNAK